MEPVAVVSDTCHYLPRELVEARGIHEVSLYVNWPTQPPGAQPPGARPPGTRPPGTRPPGTHPPGTTSPGTHPPDAVRESELGDYDAYYARLGASVELPTTSQPSIGDFLAVYEPLLDAGSDVVSIHLSGALSGTVAAAEQARDQLGERAGRVQILDSSTGCGGQGLVLLAAAAAARAGLSADEVAARARQARAELKMWFAVDTLEYLRRGGRIGAAQAWLGTALRIKPILALEAEITPFERVRTSRRAFERLVELMRTRHEAGADGWAIQHIQAPREAEALAERCREIFGRDPVFVSEIGPVIGTHVGPGLLGAGATGAVLLDED